MPFTVQQLIEGCPQPVTVSPNDSVKRALDLMIEYDFSQLPVVDDTGRSLGMVTSDSIIRSLSNFGVTIDALRVSNAMVRAVKFRPEDDLFELLDDLRDSYSALIVDGEGRLTGIVTSYDTTEFFRRRAEDIMLVEDIESVLKEHIQAAFINEKGETDQAALAAVIEQVTDSNNATQQMFQNALRHYLKLQGDSNPSLKKEWVAEAFSHFGGKKPPKFFDELTFAEYTAVLLHKSRWSAYGGLFDLDSKAILRLLDEVRTTRNDLAHFRGEISPKQRDQLRFCAEWLAYHQPAIPVALPISDRSELEQMVVREPGAPYEAAPTMDAAISPTDEVLGPDESRYAPLALWLQSQPIAQDRQTLSFNQIEEILGNKLPESARQHRSWWANDSVGHVQSQQWLEVGWRVSYINMGEGRITFARIEDRERAYIEFFSSLLPMLHVAPKFAAKTPSPDGHSWVNVAWLPDDKQQVPLAYSFARGRRFRIELYIDVGDQVKNKQIFDDIQSHKKEIELAIGEAISWERLDTKRAARIALYHEGAITDKPEQLAQLRDWAAKTMIHFYNSIVTPASVALKAAR